MASKGRDLQGFAVLLVAILAAGLLLLRNSQQPANSYVIPGPTSTATPVDNSWSDVIQSQLVNGATIIPTHDVPESDFVPPTIPAAQGTPILFQPTQVFQSIDPTATRFQPITPTRPGPTAVASPTNEIAQVVARNNPNDEQEFSLAPEIVPMSADPRDHFYFKRPVDASANSTSLSWYPYGSDGPDNTLRVHHGIDMPNPVGKEVRAAGPGHIIWAADHYVWRENGQIVDEAFSYGNVVIIDHDFGYQGHHLYTLYAHLSVILVKVNDHVDTGDIIGLSGATGEVSGPHVHFEVRVDKNYYYNTRNPLLWMAPYLDHGVVAGKIMYSNGAPVEDASVTLTDINRGRVVDTTTTYVNPHRPNSNRWDVDSDDVWGENFVFGDVPTGKYNVTVNINGVKVAKQIDVQAATTSFIDMGQVPIGFSAPSGVTATAAP